MPSISAASSSVLRRRDLLRRFAGKLDSLVSVSAAGSVSVAPPIRSVLTMNSSWKDDTSCLELCRHKSKALIFWL
ncbi:hypothetical protein EYF80_034214 [Liparis tanakae]|uniref:Uncharacterized protein n=1 Tax=Liparis tanakae TaxID=230148 RepID=A0A4Z2GQ32_9TELE|nr:hypothetical protein EYF80_034214 [Liparis tanakae]